MLPSGLDGDTMRVDAESVGRCVRRAVGELDSLRGASTHVSVGAVGTISGGVDVDVLRGLVDQAEGKAVDGGREGEDGEKEGE